MRASPGGLFEGDASLRVPGETRMLWINVVAAPAIIGLVSLILPSLTISEFVLLIAGGLVLVAVSRGRLIGSSIRVEPRQFPELAAVVDELSARMGIVPPQVFIRDDQNVPITAAGVGEPYALIVSSQYFELLREGELAFLIARELAHIAAGHTRLTSLLSASGRENPVVALVFGPWLRRCEMTADRVAVLCCDDLDDALGAICMTTFHSAGRRVDRLVLAEQRAELAADPALRLGEWTSATPYATTRLDALSAFVQTPLGGYWRQYLKRGEEAARAVALPEARPIVRADFASLGRRIAAAAVDFTFIAATIHPPVIVQHEGRADKSDGPVVAWLSTHLSIATFGMTTVSLVFYYFAYSAILVALIGQTLGMTVFDVRVVTTKFRRPSILQAVWRYLVLSFLTVTAIAPLTAAFGFFMRVQPHDFLSRTRVVRARDVV